jgi:hypothetical protein
MRVECGRVFVFVHTYCASLHCPSYVDHSACEPVHSVLYSAPEAPDLFFDKNVKKYMIHGYYRIR